MAANESNADEQIVAPSFVSFTNTWHNTGYEAISPFRPELSMKGKTVVVTGAGTGIGKAVARAFVQAGAASVAILGRREDRLKSAISDIREAISADSPALLSYEVVDLTNRDRVKMHCTTSFSGMVPKSTSSSVMPEHLLLPVLHRELRKKTL